MRQVTGIEDCSAIVTPATNAKFGDYQANGAMALAKKMKTNPRKLAEQVIEKLDVSDVCQPPEIAGPGFINLRLKPEFVIESLRQMHSDPARLSIPPAEKPRKTVVDYSSPNIAKQMHVGHLRSTILGDAICRMLEFMNHEVIRQNHIGDWGTQFGKVILALWHVCMAIDVHKKSYFKNDFERLQSNKDNKNELYKICMQIRDRHDKDYINDQLEEFGDAKKYFGRFLEKLDDIIDEIWPDILLAYRFVNLLDDILPGMGLRIITREKKDNEWKPVERPYEHLTRKITVMLQQGGEENCQEEDAWHSVKKATMEHCDYIYQLLNVTLEHPRDSRGESFYKDMLAGVVEDLQKQGLAVDSDGAVCVFPEGFKNKEGDPLPFIIKKSDGAYLYATTDLAALRYRVNELKTQRIIYVTDSRQKLHFDMLFAVARKAGWARDDVELSHVTFGSVLGEDGTPLKTRSGENIKLRELLDEAIGRARSVVEQKNPDLSEDQKQQIAKAVGIGAVKYADYSNNRTSDYIFSFDKMLAMDGNTAPYMQYAYARIKSIQRKAEKSGVDVEAELKDLTGIEFTQPDEIALAKYLIRYGEAVEMALADYRPNFLTNYLYELTQKFSGFYTNCPVIKAPPDSRRQRLLLCELTAGVIKHCLRELLGIEVVEQM